ncbi:uncharacterized protein LOC110450363 [Mizuhopecten yessoensis]|uniref:uncharacterized protein LOC110450363 n=1 Tax=Mizuhopecten yessoensis TaxID=6573 RepID=UPI000B45E428|nr:uncharacterized protein LOC110450363 [Mizuhopecten yessoensis]
MSMKRTTFILPEHQVLFSFYFLKNKAINNLTSDSPQRLTALTSESQPRFTSLPLRKNGNLSARDVLSFTIDVTNNPGPLEALSAHLWILMRKRKRKNNRGKKIFLEVLSIDDNDADYEVLTSLITRVKKTRWQKVSLPVTFIQSLLDSNTRRLRLRITCRRCGKVVRPVLFKKHKNLRKKSRRKTLKKEKRRSHQKRQAAEMRRLNRRSRRHERIPPFLVISTRYKHTVSTRM